MNLNNIFNIVLAGTILFFLNSNENAVECVDRNKFIECKESAFCRRQRSIIPDNIDDRELLSSNDFPHYEVKSDSLALEKENGVLKGLLFDSRYSTLVYLEFSIHFYLTGNFRLRIKEQAPIRNRYEVANDVLVDRLQSSPVTTLLSNEENVLLYGFDNSHHQLAVFTNPFKIQLRDSSDGRILMTINGRELLNFEHTRNKDDNSNNGVTLDSDGLWEENFGSHHDSKPAGPQSVGLDVSFIGSTHLYGLPEHSIGLSLHNTRKNSGEKITDPYRLYNLDVFEYELNNEMSLYGAVPFIMAHSGSTSSSSSPSSSETLAMFWLNSAETWVDVSEPDDSTPFSGLLSWFLNTNDKNNDNSNNNNNMKKRKDIHVFSEAGIIDLFLFRGPTPQKILDDFTLITGRPALPQLFAIAYHQCRWNYRDEADVMNVDEKMDENLIPYDVIWLDIEHTDGKRYFTWDKRTFPDPVRMQDAIASKGRKMVTIVDPHIKKDNNYYIYKDALDKNYFVKDSKQSVFEGHCWPGTSTYLDFMLPEVRDWWADQFSYDKYQGSTSNLYTWNDMNEPSVFTGPEVTMHKDSLHYHNTVEHREVHNIWGRQFHAATAEGLIKRNSDKNDRPFVLSRAFFAGTQRFGAIWTGDNTADWGHLKISIPMLLTLNIAGIPFSGADVGGFFGNPSGELMVRWYQAAAFQPFYRGHAHIDTNRREPYLFDEPYTSAIRSAIQIRYSLLPYLYTLFHESSKSGSAVMRPIWYEFPEDVETFAMDDQFMLGSSLLIHPVTDEAVTSVNVYLPTLSNWFDYNTFTAITNIGGSIHVSAPLNTIPIYIRGGSIILRKDRPRRSSAAMANDPYTIIVALDSKEKDASGTIYADDGHSFDYLNKNLYSSSYLQFKYGILKNKVAANQFNNSSSVVERIVILGLKTAPNHVKIVEFDLQLGFEYDNDNDILTVRKPLVSIFSDWSIRIN